MSNELKEALNELSRVLVESAIATSETSIFLADTVHEQKKELQALNDKLFDLTVLVENIGFYFTKPMWKVEDGEVKLLSLAEVLELKKSMSMKQVKEEVEKMRKEHNEDDAHEAWKSEYEGLQSEEV